MRSGKRAGLMALKFQFSFFEESVTEGVGRLWCYPHKKVKKVLSVQWFNFEC
jgi:hypothetical protein